jgi:hypothetical protein
MARREIAGMVSPPLDTLKNERYFNELLFHVNEKIWLPTRQAREQLCSKRRSRSMDRLFSNNDP